MKEIDHRPPWPLLLQFLREFLKLITAHGSSDCLPLLENLVEEHSLRIPEDKRRNFFPWMSLLGSSGSSPLCSQSSCNQIFQKLLAVRLVKNRKSDAHSCLTVAVRQLVRYPLRANFVVWCSRVELVETAHPRSLVLASELALIAAYSVSLSRIPVVDASEPAMSYGAVSSRGAERCFGQMLMFRTAVRSDELKANSQ
ncbi:unnamed protein product [Caenorhabditis bovis]|uniref:Uncharacterized protein n=1 Tax=Caenorhabditis bovis TaxID=2654633 RepID=A0A8S1E879_9PELO|nr:unnamed protein product [Caenorhabditis bovis]